MSDDPTPPEEPTPDLPDIEPVEPIPDIEPIPDLGAPLEPMSDADVIRYARGIVTNEYMLADVVNDRDWKMSLMLLICAWDPVPSNASCLFLVPFAPHAHTHWLNGRVPGCTVSAVCVPVESTAALVAKAQEFYELLHPEAAEAVPHPQ